MEEFLLQHRVLGYGISFRKNPAETLLQTAISARLRPDSLARYRARSAAPK